MKKTGFFLRTVNADNALNPTQLFHSGGTLVEALADFADTVARNAEERFYQEITLVERFRTERGEIDERTVATTGRIA